MSTAAGAVGSAVGQIAKILGCRAVGIAGGQEKVTQCLEVFGFDAAIDYKAPGLGDAIGKACPGGVNVYFGNTSGVISDTVYPRLGVGARVVICGTASISSWDPWPTGQRIERHLLVKRARAQGFVILDYMDRWEASIATLADWVRAGKLRYEEDILIGLEACRDALAGLYRARTEASASSGSDLCQPASSSGIPRLFPICAASGRQRDGCEMLVPRRSHCVSDAGECPQWPEVAEIWPLKAQRGNGCWSKQPPSLTLLNDNRRGVEPRSPAAALLSSAIAGPIP